MLDVDISVFSIIVCCGLSWLMRWWVVICEVMKMLMGMGRNVRLVCSGEYLMIFCNSWVMKKNMFIILVMRVIWLMKVVEWVMLWNSLGGVIGVRVWCLMMMNVVSSMVVVVNESSVMMLF